MTNKLNEHQIDAIESLNQQIIDNDVPNAKPYPIDELMSAANDESNTNTSNDPKQSQGGAGMGANWATIQHTIITNIQKTSFLDLLIKNGSDKSEFCGADGNIKITEDLKCSLAVQYGLAIAEKIGYTIPGELLKDDDMRPYVFNGKYWEVISRPKLTKLFRQILPLLGFDKAKALMLPRLSTHIIGAFNAIAEELPPRDLSCKKLNLANGALEVINGKINFTNRFNPFDGFTYCLPYAYKLNAPCPQFKRYLDRVLPDKESQVVLQEVMGLALVNENIQKIPYLLGDGSNGKSVLNDIMRGILGANMTRITLRNLMGDKSERNQAQMEGVFLNYPPENEDTKPTDFRHELFRTLADRNPLTVQKLYVDLYEIQHYAYSVFNVNNLPKNPELTHAFFRRVMPILFDQTIEDHEKDPELSKKIMADELSGVLNWVIDGAQRLQKNKKFSQCKKSDDVLSRYKMESDVVAMWIHDRGYVNSKTPTLLTKLIQDLDRYIEENDYKYNIKAPTLAHRLRGYKFQERNGKPLAFYIILGDE